jgi:hypothetical protein
MPTSDPDETRAAIADLQARVAALEDRQRRTTGARDEADAALLRTIAETAAGTVFTSRELHRHANAVPALRVALRHADADTPRRLGWLLSRLEGCPVNGLVVVRLDDGRDGIRWCVRVSRLS